MDALVAQFIAAEAVLSEDARSVDFEIMLDEFTTYAVAHGYNGDIDVWSVVQALAKCNVPLSSWCGDEMGFSNVTLKGSLLKWIKQQELNKLEEAAKAEARAKRKKTTTKCRKTTTKRMVIVESDQGENDDESIHS